MKKHNYLIIFLLILFLNGCATPGLTSRQYRENLVEKKNWPKETKQDFLDGKIKLGMTKEQIFFLAGSPWYWTKHPTSEGVFESWLYIVSRGLSYGQRIVSYDFKDGILIGYSGNGIYVSEKYFEDVRNFEK